MGLHKFLMKHGIGSPGHVAKTLAKRYKVWKQTHPTADERTVLRSLLLERIAAQTTIGGPRQYHLLRADPSAVDELLSQNPDLFSIIMLSIFVEHPELTGSYVPAEAFKMLSTVVPEVLDSETPGWRTAGLWGGPSITCNLCRTRIGTPNPSRMQVIVDVDGSIGYLCEECAPPIEMRAMSAVGFFVGRD